MTAEPMKKCSRCREWKGRACFSQDRYRKDGLQSRCKGCNADYYKANRERIASYNADYYKANRKRIAAYKADYQMANRSRSPPRRPDPSRRSTS